MTLDDPSPAFLTGPLQEASHLLLAAIVDSSDDAIVSKGLDGIVTSWNKAAQRLFHYTAEEMIGQPITRLIPAERADEEPKIIERLKRGERVDHFETVRVRKTGELIEVSLSISPIKNNRGEIIGAAKIARDITEQKRIARQLAETTEELRRADRLKMEFLTTLSHELRTPLNAIAGWTQILQDGPPSAEELAEGLAVIDRNTRAQTQMIEDLLDMSRIEAGKATLDIQQVDLPAVMRAAIDSIRPAAAAKNIQVTETFSTFDGVVMGDKNRLQQVFWNLLTNAVKFTPRDGRVYATIRPVEAHVEISVSDNGQGIPPTFLHRVFDRFGQADASITRHHGGLGLGLTIVKQLVELQAGEVRASSQGLGMGSTFTVSLPLVSAPLHSNLPESAQRRAAVHGALALETDLTGIKVLAVDDEADSVRVLKRILESRHAKVHTANSVDEALAALPAFQPDIIVSDIGMPGKDGYELISQVRLLQGGMYVPAIALTALARSDDRARALQAGFQLHLAKPVHAVELASAVKGLCSLRPGC